MADKLTIEFKLFGGFKYKLSTDTTWSVLSDIPEFNVGKKLTAFITYLVVNCHRDIPSNELIENFWSNDNKDPSNSLKTTIHKIRNLLKTMFPQCDDLIVTIRGGYAWNPNVNIHVDIHNFESLCRDAKKLPDASKTLCQQEAISLYSGEIVTEIRTEWADNLNLYYRTMFVDTARPLIAQLARDEHWDDVMKICEQGYFFAPKIEDFTHMYMQALITTGQPNKAIKHYEQYRDMLWKEYGLLPPLQVEHWYAKASSVNNTYQGDTDKLIRQIIAAPQSPKAFQCNLLVFRNIVQLELRNMLRNPDHESCVLVLNIMSPDNNQASTEVSRLERILLYGLRASDPFCKMDMGQFIVLLNGASEENSHKVVERINKNFHTTYPRSKARLAFRVYPLKQKKNEPRV